MPQNVVLVVLDGWGIGAKNETNPIYSAHPEYFKYLEENFPMASLQASGISVGLPWNETGNSEVGHLTLGAGKVVYQYYPRIVMAIRDGSFYENKVLKDTFAHAKANGGAVHMAGLLTKANTHASMEHLAALISMGEKGNVPVYLDLFTDAIDSPPQTAEELLSKIPLEKVATITGRHFAMDRSENWPLVERAYNAITKGVGTETKDVAAELKAVYEKNLTEEFLEPVIVDKSKCLKDGDSIFFFNFREDSIRELASTFIKKDFGEFPLAGHSNLHVATMTKYHDDFDAPIAFPAEDVVKPLGKVISDAGKTQLRIAESYKYAHVTYFFNGHVEEPFKNEYRVLIPSQKSAHPDEHPELMAAAITDRAVEAVN
ncbi:MAG: 2,3-bisphosphoglycerate-independent phosphoglycerate mutase, partial [Candidatus Liptonbacteria bacterium]